LIPFLKTLAASLFNKYGRNIQDVCLVFPNRRAGLFFRRYLAEAAGISLCSPQIFTVNEFMVELSDLQPADPVELIFEIYEVYAGMSYSPESFDDFYHWGEAMIRDFDDLDKSMVDARALFTNILDIKKIDTIFDYLTEEQKNIIRQFWGSFSNDKLSKHQDKFLNIWKLLYPIYSTLNKKLKENGLAYEGMIYRQVAERIIDKRYPELPWSKIILAGFNALSKAEKILFRYFRDSGKGEFFWDYDRYYTENTSKEAGRFIRNNLIEFPAAELKNELSNLGSQKISIYELPSDVAQAKFINKLLEYRDVSEMKEFHNTALILCNESLLIPVLYSIPQQIKDINITMGYPLSLTPVCSLIEQIITMQGKAARQSGKKENKFYHKHVLSILEHQYIRALAEAETSSLKTEIHARNIIYVDISIFRGKGLLEKIFIKINDVGQLMDYLISLICEIVKTFSLPEAEFNIRLEKEYIFYLLTSLRKFKRIYKKHSVSLSIETFSRLFRKVIRSVRIPFEGEPLAGIQVMGILETRLLDFKNLIFLSMNEGIMPATYSLFSYIPNSLRYGFNMPSREDHDAIYAYYFYRILQRAENVILLYNNKTEGVLTGEMSRYLYQLLYDKQFTADFKSIGFNIKERAPIPVNIKKSPEIMDKLKRFMISGDSFLSPSSLSSYLDCRLKFYLGRIAGIRESDEVSEEIDARDTGLLLHDTMFRLYQPWNGKRITKTDISNLLDNQILKFALDGAFRKQYYKTTDESVEVIPEGKNIIIYEVIRKFVEKILQTDQRLAPFEILALEKIFRSEMIIRISAENNKIMIGGKIDRIDKIDDKVRIIDYKTGEAVTGFRSIDDLFDRTNLSKNKAVLQTLIYSWLYSNSSESPAKITAGLYLTRKIFNEEFDPAVKFNNTEVDFLSIKDTFSIKLQETIEEIFNQEVSFDQTTIADLCRYCDFAGICHRDEFKSYK